MNHVIEYIAIILSMAALFLALYLVLLYRRIKYDLETIIVAARARDLERVVRRLKERPRKRYIVFEILAEKPISEQDLRAKLYSSARRVLGDAEFAKSGFQIVYYNKTTMRGILRIREPFKLKALGVLGLVREINEIQVLISPIATTGTIKRAKKIADYL